MSTKKMIYVHGDGQADYIATLIREACPEWDVRSRAIYTRLSKEDVETYKENILSADWVITRWVGPAHQNIAELSLDWIKHARKDLGKIVLVPSLVFRGHMPHVFSLPREGLDCFKTPQPVPYHNILIPYFIAQNASDQEIIRRLESADLYPDGFVAKQTKISLDSLRRSEEFLRSRNEIGPTVRVSDLVAERSHDTMIGWTPDHPTRQVMAPIANRLLELMGAPNRLSITGPDFFYHTRCGILVSIARQLNLPEGQAQPDFVHGGRGLTVAQFVRHVSPWYRSIALNDLRAMLSRSLEIQKFFQAFESRNDLDNRDMSESRTSPVAETRVSTASANERFSDIATRANAALMEKNTEAAMGLAKELMREFPARPLGYQLTAQIHLAAEQFSLAESVVAEGMRRCSIRWPLLAVKAAAAAQQDKWFEAREHWYAVLDAAPGEARAIVGLSEAHLALGAVGEAEKLLSQAIVSQPKNFHVSMAWARAASRRGDWSEALRRWSQLSDAHPSNGDIRHQLGVAKERWFLENAIDSDDEDADLTPAGRAQIESAADPELRKFVLGFESLGSNCEFGLVQRRYDAEPLSLLRWAWTPYASLVHLLATRFESMGDPASTKLLVDKVTKEWNLYDETSRVSFHTFIRAESSEPKSFISKQLKRIDYLRKKLLEELATGEKIFVYFTRNQSISTDQMKRLHKLLYDFGPITLLWVAVAKENERTRLIETISPGLMRGLISRDGRVGQRWDVVFGDWIELCRKAYQIRFVSSAVDVRSEASLSPTVNG